MTIDEAIRHAEEVAESKKIESETAEIQGCDKYALKCEECAEEHRQLAEWLRDYKRLLEQEPENLHREREQAYMQGYEDASKRFRQEPCEDCISRQAVLDLIADYDLSMGQVVKGVHDLLPVTPQPKTGRWIDDKCSVCGKGIEDLIDSREWYRNEDPNFCSFCGAKMVEP